MSVVLVIILGTRGIGGVSLLELIIIGVGVGSQSDGAFRWSRLIQLPARPRVWISFVTCEKILARFLICAVVPRECCLCDFLITFAVTDHS